MNTPGNISVADLLRLARGQFETFVGHVEAARAQPDKYVDTVELFSLSDQVAALIDEAIEVHVERVSKARDRLSERLHTMFAEAMPNDPQENFPERLHTLFAEAMPNDPQIAAWRAEMKSDRRPPRIEAQIARALDEVNKLAELARERTPSPDAHSTRYPDLWKLSRAELIEITLHLSAWISGEYETALEDGRAHARVIEERNTLRANGLV